jgi:hypothetical protein
VVLTKAKPEGSNEPQRRRWMIFAVNGTGTCWAGVLGPPKQYVTARLDSRYLGAPHQRLHTICPFQKIFLTGAAPGRTGVYEGPWSYSRTKLVQFLSTKFTATLLSRKLAILKYTSLSKPHKPLASCLGEDTVTVSTHDQATGLHRHRRIADPEQDYPNRDYPVTTPYHYHSANPKHPKYQPRFQR